MGLKRTYQPHPLEPLLQLLLGLPLPQHALQFADQLRGEPLRLHVDVLWNAVCALGGEGEGNVRPSAGRCISSPSETSGGKAGHKQTGLYQLENL